jgi:hypothetical protein
MNNYLVYGQVRNIDVRLEGGFLGFGRRPNTYLTLETGHSIRIDADEVVKQEISVGQTHFVKCAGNNPQSLSYRASRPCDMGPEIKVLHKNLERAATKAIDATLRLNRTQRGIVFRAVGVAVSGTISAASLLSAAGLAADAVAGTTFEPTAFVTSAGIGAASGVYAYLQYEQLQEDLKPAAKALAEYKKAHKLYSKLLSRYIPLGAAGHEPLNPEVKSLMSYLRRVFDCSNVADFWKANIKISTPCGANA